MISKKNKNRFKENLNFCFDLLKGSKLKLLFTCIFLVIALLTGIIVATKTHSHYEIGENYGVVDVTTGGVTTTFFARLFSMILIAGIVFGCSFISYLYPLAVVFLAYRAYLFGLNIALMLILYGFSGVIVTFLVVLPCQLLALIILTVFYLLMALTTKDLKCFGATRLSRQRSKILVMTFIALLVICILESILLWLFSAKIILII